MCENNTVIKHCKQCVSLFLCNISALFLSADSAISFWHCFVMLEIVQMLLQYRHSAVCMLLCRYVNKTYIVHNTKIKHGGKLSIIFVLLQLESSNLVFSSVFHLGQFTQYVKNLTIPHSDQPPLWVFKLPITFILLQLETPNLMCSSLFDLQQFRQRWEIWENQRLVGR